MQASIVLVSGGLGLAALWLNGDWRWIAGAMLILLNWPYTIVGIRPTNHRLDAIADDKADGTSRALIEQWGRLHAGRTALGAAATAAYLSALS